jgi:hypothetical protein
MKILHTFWTGVHALVVRDTPMIIKKPQSYTTKRGIKRRNQTIKLANPIHYEITFCGTTVTSSVNDLSNPNIKPGLIIDIRGYDELMFGSICRCVSLDPTAIYIFTKPTDEHNSWFRCDNRVTYYANKLDQKQTATIMNVLSNQL